MHLEKLFLDFFCHLRLHCGFQHEGFRSPKDFNSSSCYVSSFSVVFCSLFQFPRNLRCSFHLPIHRKAGRGAIGREDVVLRGVLVLDVHPHHVLPAAQHVPRHHGPLLPAGVPLARPEAVAPHATGQLPPPAGLLAAAVVLAGACWRKRFPHPRTCELPWEVWRCIVMSTECSSSRDTHPNRQSVRTTSHMRTPTQQTHIHKHTRTHSHTDICACAHFGYIF